MFIDGKKETRKKREINLITMPPVSELFDDGSGTNRSAIDIWVIQLKQHYQNITNINYAMSKGDEIWFYTGLVQDGYSPKWLIDFLPVNYRIPHGFIGQFLNYTGLLYWRADSWTSDP